MPALDDHAMTETAPDTAPAVETRPLRLLTFNIQAGAKTSEMREYVTRGWQSVLPNREKQSNLGAVARLAGDYDIVALQEADAHSVRSGFRHQVEWLAESSGLPFWSHQRNRALTLAAPGNGVLSRIEPSEILAHKLPGRIPGRGVLELRFGRHDDALRVFVAHLSLTPSGRRRQADYLAEVIGDARHAVVMGDLNCEPDAAALGSLFSATRLRPAPHIPSFPAWGPLRSIDQILFTSALRVRRYEVLNLHVSDHLPVGAEIDVPVSAFAA
jgi:endonuclease/exonuclease/phosphatase family metal-dependent hydrolase